MSDVNNAPVEQLWYTWSDVGLSTVHAGFRVRAASPGLTEIYGDRVQSMDRYMRYALSPGVDRSTITPEMAPVGLAFIRSEWNKEYILIHKNYLGKDGVGRSGNFFVHVLALGEYSREFSTEDAIWQWESSIWKTKDDTLDRRSTRLDYISPQDLENPTTHFRPEQFRQVQAALQFIIEAYLTRKDRTIPLYIAAPADQAAKIAYIIAALTNCLPAQLLADLTFSTYEPDITKATTEIVGTSWIPLPGKELDAAAIFPKNMYLEKLAVNCATGEKSLLKSHPQATYNQLAADFAAYATESLTSGVVDQLYALRNYAEKSRELDIPLFLQMYSTEIVNTTSMGEAEIEKYLASDLRVEWLLRRNSRKKIIDRALASSQWSTSRLYPILLNLRTQAEQESIAIAQAGRRIGTSLLSGEPEQVPGVASPEIQRRKGKKKGGSQTAKIQATLADALALLSRSMIPEAIKRMEQAPSFPTVERNKLVDAVTVLLRLMDACILPQDPTEVWKQLFEAVEGSALAISFLQSEWNIQSWLLKTWNTTFLPNSQDDDRMRPLVRIPWARLGDFLRLGLQTRHIQWVIFPIEELILDPTTLTQPITRVLEQNYSHEIEQILNTLEQGRYLSPEAGLIIRLVEKGYQITPALRQRIEPLLDALNTDNQQRRTTAKDLIMTLISAGYVGSDHYHHTLAALTKNLLTNNILLPNTVSAGHDLVITLIGRDYPKRSWLVDVLLATQGTDLLGIIQYVYPTLEGQNTFFLQEGSRYLVQRDFVQPMLTLYQNLLPLAGRLQRLFVLVGSLTNPQDISRSLALTPLEPDELEVFLKKYGQQHLQNFQQSPDLAKLVVENFTKLVKSGYLYGPDLLFTILPSQPGTGVPYLEHLLAVTELTPELQARFLEQYAGPYLPLYRQYTQVTYVTQYIDIYMTIFHLNTLESIGAKTFFTILKQHYQSLALDPQTKAQIQCWQIVEEYFIRPDINQVKLQNLAEALPFLDLTNDIQLQTKLIHTFFSRIEQYQDLAQLIQYMRQVPKVAKEKAEEYSFLYTLADLAAERSANIHADQISLGTLVPYLLFALTMPPEERTEHFLHVFLDRLFHHVKVLDTAGPWTRLTIFLEDEQKLRGAALERWHDYLNGLEIGDKLNLPSNSHSKAKSKPGPKPNKRVANKIDPNQAAANEQQSPQSPSWRQRLSSLFSNLFLFSNKKGQKTPVSTDGGVGTANNAPTDGTPPFQPPNNSSSPPMPAQSSFANPTQSSPAGSQQPDGQTWKKYR